MLLCLKLSQSNQNSTRTGEMTVGCLAGLIVRASLKLLVFEECVSVLVRVGFRHRDLNV